jgi:hypothetical protein
MVISQDFLSQKVNLKNLGQNGGVGFEDCGVTKSSTSWGGAFSAFGFVAALPAGSTLALRDLALFKNFAAAADAMAVYWLGNWDSLGLGPRPGE